MTKLDRILKSRNITLLTKVCLVKAMVFPMVMYRCESWTIKKAECWRVDPFKLWCWRRLLRVPWTARRSNQSILREISPGCSLQGLMLKLKRQYFGHLMLRAEMTEDEMVGWHHRLDELESGCTSGVGDGQGGLAYCGSWGCNVSDPTEQLNWTEQCFEQLWYYCMYHWFINLYC